VNILEGDVITQEKIVKTFEGEDLQTLVRGKVIAVQGNNITIRQLTFQSFVISRDRISQELILPAFKEGLSIVLDIQSITFDRKSLPLGLNTQISGPVGFSLGKISAIEFLIPVLVMSRKNLLRYIIYQRRKDLGLMLFRCYGQRYS